MLFNSPEFLVFLAIVYALYRVLSFRAQNYMLLAASYFFYGWWDWRFLFLIILTTTVDFWTGLVLDRGRLQPRQAIGPALFLSTSAIVLLGFDFPELIRRASGMASSGSLTTDLFPYVTIGIPAFLGAATLVYKYILSLPEDAKRKTAVTLSIVFQLGILGVFKYYNFFIDSIVIALNAAGIAAEPRHFDIVLPVGISFYTFKSLSYTIDVYRRDFTPTERFTEFALFVAFFPQLLAGPIDRAKDLLPQLTNPRILTFEHISRGVFLIIFGFFKKIAIADGLVATVSQIYDGGGARSWADVVLGTTFFLLQIYCDFSGYSDISRGVAKLFGINLVVNFNQPLFAKSPGDYWRRWHISLSRWLGNYLYKPLGGSRGSYLFTCRNLMLTMVLGGLWHGAAWNFVIWGFYSGVLLCIERAFRGPRRTGEIYESKPVLLLKIAGNGLLTLYGRMLFRAGSLDQITLFTLIMFTGSGGLSFGATLPRLSAIVGVIVLMVWETTQYFQGGDDKFYRRYPPFVVGFFVALMIFLTFMGMSNEPAQFIYFRF